MFLAALPARHLLAEPGLLLVGIVEFGEAVRDLESAGEEFEPFGVAGILRVGLRERGDLGRVTGDEGRLRQRVLDQRLEEAHQEFPRSALSGEDDFQLLVGFGEPLRLFERPRRIDREPAPGEGGDRGPGQRLPAERGLEADLAAAEAGRLASEDRLRGGGHQAFGERHHVGAAAERPVGLQHGELRVVAGGEAFVAEVAVDFVHAGEAPDDQPLQVQLGGDPQEEFEIERPVVGDERPGRRAGGQRLQHRRLHFEEPVVVEVGPERPDGRRPPLEDPAGRGVRGQVEVALAVAEVPVGEPVPLLRERQQRLRQQGQRVRANGELPGPRPEDRALHPDPVAEVEQPGEAEPGLLEDVPAQVGLDRLRTLGERGERGLAEGTVADDPARHPRPAFGLRERLEGLRVEGAPGGEGLGGGVGGLEARRPEGGAGLGGEFRDLREFAAAALLVPAGVRSGRSGLCARSLVPAHSGPLASPGVSAAAGGPPSPSPSAGDAPLFTTLSRTPWTNGTAASPA